MKRIIPSLLLVSLILFSSCEDRLVKDPEDPTAPSGTIIRDAVKDKDGNKYDAVKIGNQVWIAENLKTTKYADGTPISRGYGESYDVGYWYYPDDNSANKETYGLLYNWKAVMRNSPSSSSNPSGVQGICPDGWHVPSDAEWTELTDYVSSQNQYQCNSNSGNIAKALASTTGWNSSTTVCAVGTNPSANNATGFSAVPAGGYYGSYYGFGSGADYWSATEYNSGSAYRRYLGYDNANVGRDNDDESNGLSVRCVRD